MLFFTSDYVNTFAIIVSVFIVVLILVQVCHELTVKQDSLARKIIVLTISGLALVPCLICMVADGKVMGYQLDGARAKQDYEISGWKKEWANYLLIASVVLGLCTIFVLAIRDSEVKQSPN